MIKETYSGSDEVLGTSLIDLWETGAKELEQSDLGKLITSPVRILENVASSVQSVAKAPGAIVSDLTKYLPWIVGILAVGVGGYLIFAGRKGVKLTPMGRCK